MDDEKGLIEELLGNTVQLIFAIIGVVVAIGAMIGVLFLCWYLYDRYIEPLWFTYIGMS
jgi:hypothetical protein